MKFLFAPAPKIPEQPTTTIADLEKFAQKHACRQMHSLEEFRQYWAEFDQISCPLLKSKLINKTERDLYFWTGLTAKFRIDVIREHRVHYGLFGGRRYDDQEILSYEKVIRGGRRAFLDCTLTLHWTESESDKLIRRLRSLDVESRDNMKLYDHLHTQLYYISPTAARKVPSPDPAERAERELEASLISTPIPSLENFVREHALGSMRNFGDFREYWQDFDGITQPLMSDGRLKELGRNLYFWIGIPLKIRRCFALRIAGCRGIWRRGIPNRVEIIQAGRHVFLDHTLPMDKKLKKREMFVTSLEGLDRTNWEYYDTYTRLEMF